ncbi:ABC transporter permease [Gaopeijia maritima]|uniref:ADOP family duplicated permease n=1 Tax=Gaopeijia maritima TaxID=3119007 RepID=A0ABU9E6C9_9BACT
MARAPRPPLLARALLRLLLPGSVHDAFAGDLEERFARDHDTDPRAARRGYWRDVLSPSVLRLRREVKGMPLPPGTPPAAAARGDGFMTALLADLKFAVRMLLKAPAFTAVAVLSLALGIGPNTAIFSIVDAALLQDWGVDEPEGLVDMYSLTDDGRYFYTYYRVYELIDEGAAEVFTGVAASAQQAGTIETGASEAPELVMGELVTGNYFEVLGVRPQRGRGFLPEEDATPGTHPVVVISDRFWRTRLGSDPDAVGRDLRLNGRPYTVVGVAPPEFKGRVAPGLGTDFWAPIRMYPHLAPNQMSNGNLFFMGRLRDGVTTERARAVLDAVATRFNDERDSRSELEIGAVNLSEIRMHPNFDGTLGAMTAVLFGAVGLVLLVACVNLASFLLARATDRRKEMAVRISMGAGRGAIVRQLLVESLVLAALGGAVGLALGMAASRLLLGIDPPVDLPLAIEVGLNARLLLFTAGASLLAALVFGLTPALQATRTPVAATLRDESGSAGGRSKGRARGVLVAAQMALSTVLLFGAALFLRNLQAALAIDTGFDTGPAAVVTLEPWASEMTDAERTVFANDLMQAVGALPSVQEFGVTSRMPLDLGNTNTSFEIPGVEPPPDADRHVIEYAAVSPGYFGTMDIGVVEGRGFTDADLEPGVDGTVAILTRAAAERWWPGESAVGRVMYRGADPERAVTVVGVVDDARIWSLDEPPRAYMYLPLPQNGFGRYVLVARGTEAPLAMAAAIRDEARRLRPDVLVSEAGTMDDHLAYIYFVPRMAAGLITVVGLLALALACIGLYGMVRYTVAQRTREVGIRMALGADRNEVVGLVVRGGLTVVAVGGVAGIAVALGLGTVLERFLVGVERLDPWALLAAPAALFALSAVAAWLPARRVSRVDPVVALRSE